MFRLGLAVYMPRNGIVYPLLLHKICAKCHAYDVVTLFIALPPYTVQEKRSNLRS